MAVMEWECCIKTKKTELKKVPIYSNHIIKVTDKAFDDFAAVDASPAFNRKILGLKKLNRNR
jgi:hypothetical protein